MSTKTVTITVKNRPPCEFEDAEDLRRHTKMMEARKHQEKQEFPDWNEALRLFQLKRDASKEDAS